MKTIKDLTKRTLFIAEIGKNFIDKEEEESSQVYLEKAKKLVRAAKQAGADVVKFQTHDCEDEQLPLDIISPHFKGMDRYRWVKHNTLSTPAQEFWKPLMDYCRNIDVLFLSTPMSRGAAKKLNELGIEFWKVGSGDILDFVMLDYLADTNKPIIMSTGMSSEEEVDSAATFLKVRGADFALLHCVSKYPCPKEELKLATITYLKNKYKVTVGLSNHSLDTDTDVAAYALGARIIERHFSFDRQAWGSDHKVSLHPKEFKEMVDKIRRFEKEPGKLKAYLAAIKAEEYHGKEEKSMQEGEEVFRGHFRKTLVAARDLKKGAVITKEDVYAMRPQAYCKGLPSEKYVDVVGKRTTKAVKKLEPIDETAE